jgi:hypothetical protein
LNTVVSQAAGNSSWSIRTFRPACSSWLFTTWPQDVAYGRVGSRNRSVLPAAPDACSNDFALARSYGATPVRSSYHGSVGGTMLPISLPRPAQQVSSSALWSIAIRIA